MSKKGFYAVKVGEHTGVYDNWDECRSVVNGFKGAKYKRFDTWQQANDYVNGDETTDKAEVPHGDKKWMDESDVTFLKNDEAIAYVDGSFNPLTKEYGYGCVLLTVRGKQIFSGKGNREDMIKYQNVSGELTGAYIAINEAVKQGIKTLYLHYDYDGVEKWITGKWKAKSNVAKYYVEYFEIMKSYLQVDFTSVYGHTGIPLNEEVDLLAKQAVDLRK